MLTVLPEKYKHFSTAWDSTPKTDKTIEKLIQRLSLEEDKYKLPKEEKPVVSFKAEAKKDVTCYGCGKKGHIKPQCIANKGNNGGDRREQNSGPKPCSICKVNFKKMLTNHTAENCKYKDKACKTCKNMNHQTEDCKFKDNNRTSNMKYEKDKKIVLLAQMDSQMDFRPSCQVRK